MSDDQALLNRRATELVDEALADTRVVLLQGARQVGKSTLATRLVRLAGAEIRTLDDAGMLAAAKSDPVGFVETPQPLIIDEVQRAPELLLAIKARVDRDPRPGQFLLTGSAQVFALRHVADALPGRVETIDLWPLSQGELYGAPDGFLDAIFEQGPAFWHTSVLTRKDYAARIVRGGFPEARLRARRRLTAFFSNYLRALLMRDVRDVSEIERGPQLQALLPMLAARSASSLNATNVADQLGVSRQTVIRYIALLESVFLLARLPAWSRAISRRAVGQPKAVFIDSGIAAHLVGEHEDTLARPVSAMGPLLEGFVAMELARQCTWTQLRVALSHYRTKDGAEVDVVLEDARRRVVGIEVKAASSVGDGDFRGLRHLQARTGSDFVVGVVLYTGQQTLRFGDGLVAVPVAALWESSPAG